MSLKIDKMYAFVAEDKNGDEGVIGMQTNSGWMPLVGADMKRINSLIPIVQNIVNQTNHPVKILMFSDRKEIDEIN